MSLLPHLPSPKGLSSRRNTSRWWKPFAFVDHHAAGGEHHDDDNDNDQHGAGQDDDELDLEHPARE